MERGEMARCLEEMREIYPRVQVNEKSLEYWQEAVGKRFTRGQFMSAFKRHVSMSDSPPGIATMRQLLDAMFHHKAALTSPWDRDYLVIDFLMDMLTPAVVTDEIYRLVNDNGPVETVLARLMQKKDWVADYRKLKGKLWELSVKKWKSEGPPEKRFLRDEDCERPWDLIGPPRFVKGEHNITPSTGSRRSPNERHDIAPPSEPTHENLF